MGEANPAVHRAFLFTDIEGSTRLWERFPSVMAVALQEHNDLVHGAVLANGGSVFKTIGDAFCAVFPEPQQAIAATISAQQQLYATNWQGIGLPHPLLVRMAINTGEVQERDSDFHGPVLNRLARLLAAGHGGQVLIAGAVVEAMNDSLPHGAQLRDLGERRLRDVSGTERIFQLTIDSLPAVFPPLRTLEAVPHNLPLAPTPCIGRESERSQLRALFPRSDVRLVTLVGPGGIGKTRLAVQAANDLLDEFPNGVWFVDLSPVREAGHVAGAANRALGIREEAGKSPEDSLRTWLDQRRILLLLDNCEQIIDEVAGFAARLMQSAGGLRLLVTSRAALRIRGERQFPVEPLALPNGISIGPPKELEAVPSVQLFSERARDVQPTFAIDAENAHDVATICQLVDGIPLAIELAAARIDLLSPALLREKLSRRLPTLIAGARDMPERHQTLHNAIAWSYELASQQEQRLFRRLAVFAGGWSGSAAEAVAGVLQPDLLESLSSLVRQSLIRPEPNQDGEPRYSMLETIREFALGELEAGGEVTVLRGSHGGYFLSVAEDAQPNLYGRNLATLLAGLERDHFNFQAAIGNYLESNAGDAQRLCNALFRYWLVRGFCREGCSWFERALESSDPPADPIQARGHQAYGSLLMSMSEYQRARSTFEQALKLRIELGDQRGIAIALISLGYLATEQGDLERSGATLEEALKTLEPLGSAADLGVCHMNLATLSLAENNMTAAFRALHKAQGHFVEAGDVYGVNNTTSRLATVARATGDLELARHLLDEADLSYQEFNDTAGIAYAQKERAMIELRSGNQELAFVHSRQTLSLQLELGDRKRAVESLDILALCLVELQRPEDAVALLSCSAASRTLLQTTITPYQQALRDPAIATLEASLGNEGFHAAWQGGARWSLEDARDLVLSDETSDVAAGTIMPAATG